MSLARPLARALARPLARAVVSQATTSSFIPTDLTGLQLWLDASDESTITDAGSGGVSPWADKSGNSNDCTQATASNRLTTGIRTVNGLNALDCDGSCGMQGAVLALGEYTKIAVFVRDTNTLQNVVVGAVTGSDDYLFGGMTDKIVHFHGGTSRITGTTSISTGVAYIGTVTEPATGSAELFLNGVSEGTTTSLQGTGGSGYILTSTDGNNLNSFNGALCEVLVYNRVLDASELSTINTYLANKWGITL